MIQAHTVPIDRPARAFTQTFGSVCLRRHSLAALVALTGALVGCGTDAVTLPADYNDQRVKVIEIDATVEVGALSVLAGLQGGPEPVISGDGNLSVAMNQVGTQLLRLPEGYLCEYSLAGTVSNPTSDLADPGSYDFSLLDPVFEEASAVEGIAAGQGKLVFQAIYDIGLNTCAVEAGVQQGARPADPARWAQATVNVMRYLNRDLLDPNDGEDSAWLTVAKDYKVRWVESHDAPLGRGGYTNVADVAADFVTLGTALRGVFPVAGDSAPVQLVGPSMVLGQGADVPNHPILQFVDAVVAANQAELLDAVSFQLEVDTPAEAERISSALRSALDDRGLGSTGLWLTRYELPESRFAAPAPGDDAAPWSAFSGAWSNGVRMALQGLVDEAVYYRGDRERVQDGVDPAEPQSPLWTAGGVARPMWYAWYPWTLFRGTGPRVQTRLVDTSESDGLWTMAVRQDGAPCPSAQNGSDPRFNGAGCLKLHVLIANTNDDSTIRDVQYQLRIDGLDAPATSVKVGHWRVDSSRTGPPQDPPSFSEEEVIPLSGSSLVYQVSGSIPGVSYLEMVLFTP